MAYIDISACLSNMTRCRNNYARQFVFYSVLPMVFHMYFLYTKHKFSGRPTAFYILAVWLVVANHGDVYMV